ncbi:MAG: DOPA 4,5-dioxygenase family protein [Chromatiales bacterium]|jgi:aromatic ring-cleaving dioxygenase|nr:DOPA 4,5-dioxygenase family protein [Chromatiales bacterium]
MTDEKAITEFHAHVYFDEATVDRARGVCDAAAEKFELRLGRTHEKLVGPHPRWSCQLAFEPAQFGALLPWLALNRDGLTVFIHPESGDALIDHTDHAMWMGEIVELNLDMFRKP